MPPAPAADARTLARRLSFHLTGLPPSPALVAAFSAEHATGGARATSRLIESLLQSPHYGERWARHWLDLARYTDETPDWLESTKFAYLYRDWVVQAFNEDMPYDRFIVQQLATDCLPGSGPEDLPALGFLGLSPTYFKELQLPPDIIKTTVADEWEEHVDAVGRTFLGLTLACARCHDHKSDPITAADYYAIAGVFASVKQVELPTMSEALWAPVARAREEVAKLEKETASLKKSKPADLTSKVALLQKRITQIQASTPHYHMPMANAVQDAALYIVEAENKKGTKLDYKPGMARDLELHKRGNPNETGEVVPRRFISAFPNPTSSAPRPFVNGSGRLDLAQAITQEAAPLTARVLVNRVWKHHFGRGIVDSPSEFGNLGDAPTHPELLDALTAQFIQHGWSIKWLHREILNSATWQQSSTAPSAESVDPENKLYARMTRRRLDWEAWRDAALSAAQKLDLRMGGPALAISDLGNNRRSLYAASNRQDMDPMLRIHDVPDPGAHSAWRTETITPLQGLFSLNAPFMHQQAKALQKSLNGLPHLTIDARVQQVSGQLFQRPATLLEHSLAMQFFAGRESDEGAWSQYCHALLAGNEFLFLD